MTDWEFYYYLIDAEQLDPDVAYRWATSDNATSDYSEGGEDAYCGYDCDGYAIG